MGTPYMGEVKLISWNFPPKGWAECNGSLLPINQNQALFSLLGTTYGGNGQTTFALPDLRGRIPMHFGNMNQGERAGEAAHTVTTQEMPQHTHFVSGTSSAATTPIPTGNVFGNVTANAYAEANQLVAIEPSTIANVGGSQAHNNMSPYLVLTFVIALQGIFPSRN